MTIGWPLLAQFHQADNTTDLLALKRSLKKTKKDCPSPKAVRWRGGPSVRGKIFYGFLWDDSNNITNDDIDYD